MEKAHFTNPSEYFNLGKRLCPNINVEFVSKETIAETTSFLDMKWTNTKPVPRIHQVHCVKSYGSDSVQVSDTTDGGDVRVCVIHTNITEQSEQENQDEEEEGEQEGGDEQEKEKYETIKKGEDK